MMHALYFLSIVLVGTAYSWPDPPCRTPPLASNYTITKYSGRWFEIGKIQTAGGGFFEKDCVCTLLDVYPNPNNPTQANVTNICNKKTPSGDLIIANELLTSSMNPPNGRYNATIEPFVPPVAYNVIVLETEDYSVEYDCGRSLGITNYCVHIMSRKPTLDSAIVDDILKLVQKYDLNPKNIEYKQSMQVGCSYPPPKMRR